ncbi:GntR family transcriptional regulator [Bacillus sp. FJAT-44742]|uniref:GntR family transcriptional regulator n=1 Tax=Bacillus sp. FJAT-44742 TaxID=2014005 RepID=UPI000C23538F|nr:GntR family transcriptional regulator [Bacillus sp. FJAT-44742]
MVKKSLPSNPIKQKPLSQVAAEELRRRIWSGEISFGQRLLEANLASELDISRSSLREALQTLEYEGLVINKARKGTFVSSFTDDDLREINEIRLHLEVPAIVKAAENIIEKDIQYLELLIRHMEEESQKDDWQLMFNLDISFHLYLINCCDNSRIKKMYNIIQMQIRTFLSQLGKYYSKNVNQFIEEHKELLEAVKSRDKKRVEAVASAHILDAGDFSFEH